MLAAFYQALEAFYQALEEGQQIADTNRAAVEAAIETLPVKPCRRPCPIPPRPSCPRTSTRSARDRSAPRARSSRSASWTLCRSSSLTAVPRTPAGYRRGLAARSMIIAAGTPAADRAASQYAATDMAPEAAPGATAARDR